MLVEGVRKWTLDDEIMLFNLVCDHKPAGKNKHRNMVQIIDKINKHLPAGEQQFTASEIWDKLEELYNLDRVDQIEEFESTDESKKDRETRSKAWHKPRTRSQVTETSDSGESDRRKRHNASTLVTPIETEENGTDASEPDSNENEAATPASDNNTEPVAIDKEASPVKSGHTKLETQEEKLSETSTDENQQDEEEAEGKNDNNEGDGDDADEAEEETETETASKRITRRASRRAANSDVESTPKPLAKKRTRSVSKQVFPEETPVSKRRKTASPVPQTPAAKRRTRSTDVTKETEEFDNEQTEPPKRRRSMRALTTKESAPKTPVRRSTRRK
ncbi:esa1-associated factor [Scheffersomyces spartinae]|uniref:Chromatin modification-related protein EAF7 n=1 Tax=Scheffersomyces spartinae TaxID=45513 RepID=A0A9P8AHH4_9ASCO|nr:esa1-associated factor [Scheffersomyces spartinae]KAG7192148.1 esa1-associated factor [Scheffersomyces spartinae]